MILNKLAVKNFGPYRGSIEIDLNSGQPNGNGKSVLLFGGKNGAGKTNLFEAVNLCLYGAISIGRGTSRKEYENYLIEKIHRTGSSEGLLDAASVSLEFTHAHLGILDKYFVNREWKRNGQGVQELIEVKKNGKPYDNLSQDQWDTFIKELIPPIIAQIFFFDGEKIRRLSGDRNSDNIYLADSVKALLGIDLTERLRDDLLIYQKKFTEQIPEEMSYVTERWKIKEQIEALEGQRLSLRQDRAGIESRMVGLIAQIKILEDKIASLGGEFHAKREGSKASELRLKVEIEELQNRMAELCQHLFPFSLCQNLCHRVKDRINAEQATLHNRSCSRYTKEFIENIIQDLKDSLIHKSEEYKIYFKEYLNYLECKCDELLNCNSNISPNVSIINELSTKEIEQILIWIDEAQTEIPQKMKYLGNELRIKTDQLFEIEKDLARIPSEDILRPHIEEMKVKNQELGTYKQVALELDDKISNLSYQILLVERNLRKHDQDAASSEKLSEKIRLIAGTQEVLKAFADSLRRNKILKLEDEMLSLFNKLCRKDDLISKIKINQDDLMISIYDSNGERISKKSLSSGERQILAISILWALKKISNRPIPVIIDTPLSRLDSDHRRSLIQNFFPAVSHQTIILSTDTEVNKGYFKELSEHISHMYHLRYDEKEKKTIVEKGYFRQGV